MAGFRRFRYLRRVVHPEWYAVLDRQCYLLYASPKRDVPDVSMRPALARSQFPAWLQDEVEKAVDAWEWSGFETTPEMIFHLREVVVRVFPLRAADRTLVGVAVRRDAPLA